jgi:hypothetical protein
VVPRPATTNRRNPAGARFLTLRKLTGATPNIMASNLPFLSISGGSRETPLAVAIMNTGAFFSCIREMKEPKTLLDVPPSVEFELLVPLHPFSISSL